MRKAVVTFTLLIFALLSACTSTDIDPSVETISEIANTVAPATLLATDIPPTATATLLPTQPPPPTATQLPVAVGTNVATTEAATAEPTATALPEPTEAPIVVAPLDNFGRTTDGGFYVGNEDAAVTIIDYSDFL